jgi:GNAT superfamily N-acetyltransferase
VSADPGVRVAGQDDLGELARLAERGADGVRDSRGGAAYLLREGHRTTPIAESLEAHDTLVLLGGLDEVPVGYLVAVLVPLPDGSVGGLVREFYVEPEARELGVGEALMDVAIAWCRRHACTGIDAIALPGDRGTKNFFETFGLVARAIVVNRTL